MELLAHIPLNCTHCCSAYLDVFNLPPLHAPFRLLYRRRFGEDPVLPDPGATATSSSRGGLGGAGAGAGAGR